MQSFATGNSVKRPRRSGYTLVEILIVIAIIGLLASLSIAAVMQLIPSQQEKSTKFIILELMGSRKKHYAEVAKVANEENIDPLVVQMAGGDKNVARILWVKFRLKQEFPISFAEALNPFPLPPKPSYVAYLNNCGITTATLSSTPAPHESAACLYMSLTQSRNNVTLNANQLGSAVGEFPTPKPAVKIKAFVDGWGNPLVFSRWPTGDQTLNSLATSANSQNRDPEDPQGLLLGAAWYSSPGRPQFEQLGVGHLVKTSQGTSYYLLPVIVSAGRDGKLGIVDVSTLTVTNPADAKDNIYSYKIERE